LLLPIREDAMTNPRSAIWLPIFDELADPTVVARLAAEAEEHGWDGVFVWDHLRWREPVVDVADAWITLAAIAMATERVRIGPMVSPLPRRRPAKVAKEAAALDRLSGGRLTLGVGIGEDRFGGEFSMTGEQLEVRIRAQMLDESLEILAAAWSGEPVRHRGEHYTVHGHALLPTPGAAAGDSGVGGGFPGQGQADPPGRAARRVLPGQPRAPGPAGRGGRHDSARCAVPTPGRTTSRSPLAAGTELAPYVAAGATWWMAAFSWEAMSVDTVRGVIKDGPARG
jgi:hypothetical protein